MREEKCKRIALFVLVAILSSLLVACSLRISPAGEQISFSSFQIPHKIEPLQLVSTTFNLELKQSNSPDTEIVLDVLDDVTGLDHNIKRYPLTKISENHYSASLLLPLGSNTHYRYSSVKPVELSEVNANGDAVIYRNVIVGKSTVVNDILAGWPNLPYSGETGTLNGIVSDSESDKPIADVLVSLAGYQTYTDVTGRFYFENIPAGIHNLVATSIDGSFQDFQQEANILSGLATPAVIKMKVLQEVKIKFIVTPPNDALGAPIRMAGSFYQLGNTYADLDSGVSAGASRMPLMTKLEDGNYAFDVVLHAGNFLSYKFTLGDGYINAERSSTGELVTRQFIVPDRDLTVEDSIISWRPTPAEPASIEVSVPANTPAEDSISIQFQQDFIWNPPIPMWPMGSNQWMYLYYGNPQIAQPVLYRFCRNDQCQLAYDESSFANPYPVVFENPVANKREVTAWHLWQGEMTPALVSSNSEPTNSSQLSGVELVSDYTPSALNRYRDIFPELKSLGMNWLILTPSWKVSQVNNLPYLDQDPSSSMLISDMKEIVRLAKENGFSVGLYPQLNFQGKSASWWENSPRNALWWQQWYAEYERFLMNYVVFSADNNVDQIVVGGPGINPSLPGVMENIGENFVTLKTSDEIWANLLTKINNYFDGELLWGLPVGQGSLPTYSFYSNVDGFYFEIQSSETDFNATQDSVSHYIDSWILDFHNSYSKPVYFGLNSPSISTAENITDGVISPADPRFNASNVNLEIQDYFYDVYGAVLTSRDWISGVSSRGFYPVVKLTDFSSSVYGKPALFRISYYNTISH